MTSIQRIQKFLSGLGMLLGSIILALEPENGYHIIAFLLSISLTGSGIRFLFYYFTMARNMVGGKSILYRALILMDLGLFTWTTINIPKIYLICHLLISHGFSGLVDMLKAVEDKKLQSSSWRMSFIYGLGNIFNGLYKRGIVQLLLGVVFDVMYFYWSYSYWALPFNQFIGNTAIVYSGILLVSYSVYVTYDTGICTLCKYYDEHYPKFSGLNIDN
jgi:hypothetical protein